MQLIPLKDSHVQEIIELSNTAFGTNFLTEEYISLHINSTTKSGFVAIQNNKVVGYILTEVFNPAQFINEVLIEKEWFAQSVKDYNSIFLIKQIVVHQHYQKKGLATQLIEEVLIKNKTSDIVYCLAWKKGNNTALRNILLSNNFNYQITISDYWKQDSVLKNYGCTYCNSIPCKCATEVYIQTK